LSLISLPARRGRRGALEWAGATASDGRGISTSCTALGDSIIEDKVQGPGVGVSYSGAVLPEVTAPDSARIANVWQASDGRQKVQVV